MATPLHLLRPHIIHGHWWDNTASATKRAGVLKHLPDGGLSLCVRGFFELKPGPFFSREIFRNLYGVDDTGATWTLFDCASNGHSFSSTRSSDGLLGQKHYQISVAVRGILNDDSLDTLPLRSVRVAMSDLRAWDGRPAFRDASWPDSEAPWGAELPQYVRPTPITAYIPTIGADISIEAAPSGSIPYLGGHSLTVRHNVLVTIAPTEHKNYTWYRHVIWILQTFFSCCMSRPVNVRLTSAKVIDSAGQSEDQHGDLLTWFASRRERPASNHEMLVPFACISEIFGDALDKWFNLMNTAREPIDLYFSSYYTKIPRPSHEFLLQCQVAEGLHRVLIGGTVVDTQAFQFFATALKSHIQASVQPVGIDLWSDMMRSRVMYANDPSLRRRLREMFALLTPSVARLITSDSRRFISRIVDARNYYTHYPNDRGDILGGGELFCATAQMRAMILFVLMKKIGIPDDVLLRRLDNTRIPVWTLNRFDAGAPYTLTDAALEQEPT